MLANTQPETPLAPHTTVYGPNTTPGALQRAGCVYNHRRHNRHRHWHQIRPPHTRREGPLKHPVHHAHGTAEATRQPHTQQEPRARNHRHDLARGCMPRDLAVQHSRKPF